MIGLYLVYSSVTNTLKIFCRIITNVESFSVPRELHWRCSYIIRRRDISEKRELIFNFVSMEMDVEDFTDGLRPDLQPNFTQEHSY